MRILWVKAGPLHPLDTGGKRRTHAMLAELGKEHEITYLALKSNATPLAEGERDDPYARTKEWVPWEEAQRGSPRFWISLAQNAVVSSLPYALGKYRCPPLSERLRTLPTTGQFDIIVCDFLAPALNFVNLPFPVPTVLFQHNMEAQIWKRMAGSQKSPLKKAYFCSQYQRMQSWEGKLSRIFNGVITVSPEDTEHARNAYGLTNVLGHVPTGVDVSTFRPLPSDLRSPASGLGPPTIGFLGSMDWMPNIDAVQYFVADILPRLRSLVPGARFKIIGRNPTASIRQLATQDSAIEVTGTVEDVRPHVHDCQVIVVPLRAGGGTRIKIFEAMAMGIPVVSTTIGAEGLPVTHDQDILLADDSTSFADALTRLAREPTVGRTIAARARAKVVQDHSWKVAAGKFIDLCEPLFEGRKTGTGSQKSEGRQ